MPRDAVNAGSASPPPGFFGKLPSRGDFVTRRLSPEFVGRWDGWLQEAIAASRTELDKDWLDVYLTSPIWRFALAPGVCGPHGAMGVMIPSVDKVGRYFPLAAVSRVETSASPLAVAAELEEWFANVEALLLATLAETPLELEAFDDRLARLVPGTACRASGPGLVESAASPWYWSVTGGGLGDALAVLGADALMQAGWRSVWWSQGSERIEPCVLLAAELPDPRAFGAMLDGDWTKRGWRRGVVPERRRRSELPERSEQSELPERSERSELPERSERSELPERPARPERPDGVGAARSAGVSDTGKVRKVNEDAWACRNDLGIWIVADGLGGHQAGELASRMVVASLEGVDGKAPGEERVGQLVRGLDVANRCLRVLAECDAAIRLAASTVAALIVDGGRFASVWAGDSRIYRLRNGRLEQLSDDHSEPASDAFDLRAVTRAVGGGDTLELSVVRGDVVVGDRFLLCSDGLYSEVDEAAIVDALSLPEPERGCAQLRDAALGGDARDNLTAVVVHVGGEAIG